MKIYSPPSILRPYQQITKLWAGLGRLIFTVLIAGTALVLTLGYLLLLAAPSTQAAPVIRPLFTIVTTTGMVAHTSATTHQMTVFDNGQITNRFLADNPGSTNQIGADVNATTIAILFDQHSGDNVDVGSQLEFSPATSISLYTSPDNHYPAYSEDTYAVYASRALSYQVTQRTLATTTNNCVIMELVISNTGSFTLTGGKLLYMVDIQTGLNPTGDEGRFDSSRRMVYQKDFNGDGFATGICLLQGDLRGYGVNGNSPGPFPPSRPDPALDSSLKNEMITPTNAITDGNDDVSWLVANIPDLSASQSATLVFALCARTASTEAEAADTLIDTFAHLANLSTLKTAIPPAGSTIAAGNRITYTIALSSTGERYVDDIVVTDTIPVSTDLITYSTSRGSITAANGLITATVGRLDSTSGTVTITLVVAPKISSTNGAVISNQAFIHSEPIVTSTNVVTHQIINQPIVTVTKTAAPTIGAGQRLTYTMVISNSGQGYATGVTVSDTLPSNTNFVSGSIAVNPTGVGQVGSSPPTLVSNMIVTPGQNVTVTFAVDVTEPLAIGTIITNRVSVTSPQLAAPAAASVTTAVVSAFNPQLMVIKYGPQQAQISSTIVYSFVVVNVGANTQALFANDLISFASDLIGVAAGDGTPISITLVNDSITGPGVYAYALPGGDNDTWLDGGEAWVYTATYTIQTTGTLTNIVTVEGYDQEGEPLIATDTHTLKVVYLPYRYYLPVIFKNN